MGLFSKDHIYAQCREALDGLRASYPQLKPMRPRGAVKYGGVRGTVDDTLVWVSFGPARKGQVSMKCQVFFRPALGLGLFGCAPPKAKASGPVGSRPVYTGDAEFDGRFTLRSADPDRAGLVLNLEVRQAALTLLHTGDTLELSDAQIAYSDTQPMPDPEQALHVTRSCLVLAQTLRRSVFGV